MKSYQLILIGSDSLQVWLTQELMPVEQKSYHLLVWHRHQFVSFENDATRDETFKLKKYFRLRGSPLILLSERFIFFVVVC